MEKTATLRMKTSAPLPRPSSRRNSHPRPKCSLPRATVADQGEQFQLNSDDPRLIAPPEPLPEADLSARVSLLTAPGRFGILDAVNRQANSNPPSRAA